MDLISSQKVEDEASYLEKQLSNGFFNFAKIGWFILNCFVYFPTLTLLACSETLRKWPVVPISDRACTKDYTIEPKTPSETPLRLKKGDIVWIPTYAVQRDPENFKDPDVFDPERFNDLNKSKVNSSNYLPFGSGPRSCIGSRFAMMENKTLFVHLLRKFEIVPVKKTVVPLELSRSHFNLTSNGGLWLGLKKRIQK